MPLLPGEILSKRYRIVHLLAEGSYGAVYRAWDSVAGQDVAVKEYLDSSVEIQKRFRQEARRLSRLQHAQIPAVLDHFALEGVGQYLVSEFVDGVDAQSLLEAYGRLPSDLIIHWLQAIAAPLTYLHQNDQLHLNIKPANIRITPQGDVFLVNTGLPGIGVRPRATGYGAPEQQSQSEVSPATDIYSLGATLYVLLTGDVPPPALSRASGLTDLIPAREVNPDVEPYLSLVAGRAMSLRPDTRYDTAVDFAQALERPIGKVAAVPASSELRRTVSQMGTAVAPQLPPSRRRQMEQRTIWALVGVLAVLLVVIFASVRLSQSRQPTEEEQIEATATFVSAVAAAATALAPTPTPLPVPTDAPTPTPQPITTDTGSRMLYVPGGVSRMGIEDGERDEEPSHLVRLEPFYIDETEVTNAQYQQCVDAGGCQPPSSPNALFHPAYYGNNAYDEYPVVNVDWYAADTFCAWRGARLPSEAEWEKAAGFNPAEALVLRYPWGAEFDGTKANYCDASCTFTPNDPAFNDGHQDTAPVGSYPDGRSPLGLYDMVGNVVEWVADWYDPAYYQTATDTNPLGPPQGEYKVIRGGSLLSQPDNLTVYGRGSFDPLVARGYLGFRCAMDAN